MNEQAELAVLIFLLAREDV